MKNTRLEISNFCFACCLNVAAPDEEGYPTWKKKDSSCTVGSWLKTLGMSRYEACFRDAGYDDIAFVGNDVLTEVDLETIGVTEPQDRSALLDALEKKGNSKGKRSYSMAMTKNP